MLKISAISKDLKLANADYVFEKTDKFMRLLPYLYPKISGDWYIAILEPKPETVRTFLDTEVIPEYVTLELFMEQSQLENLMMERPSMQVEVKTAWQKYQDLIAGLDIVIDDKAVNEIYRRVGSNINSLEETLTMLSDKSGNGTITIKDVRLYVQDNSHVYASQVVRAFLTGDVKAWNLFSIYEKELGTEIAFYAMRKYIRKLLKDKNAYLLNEEYKDKNVERIDAFAIMRAYKLFEEAESYKQLVPILMLYQTKGGLE